MGCGGDSGQGQVGTSLCGLLCCEVSAEHTKAQSHVGPTVTGLVGDTGVKRDGVLSRGVAAMGEAGLGVTTTP